MLKIRIMIVSALFLTIVSCGYRFTGSGDFPKGVTSVYIPIFENRTSETGIGSLFTNELVIQILKKGKVKVAGNRSEADAVLNGVVVTLRDNAVSSDETLTQSESKLILYADIKLVGKNGQILLNIKGINETKSYTTFSNDKQTSLSNKSSALEELSKNLAETVYNRLTDDF